ncbi:MAG: SRPBCC family protein [Kofleriaceae bacterium]
MFSTDVQRADDRTLVLKRVFPCSPITLYRAMTEPELMKRWWAPTSLGVVVHSIEADVRVGGAYRYVFGPAGAPPMAFRGVYTVVEPAERVVYTQLFEPMPDTGEGLITATYSAVEGGTLLVQREVYPSKEVLDGAIASGMERGMRETLDQLAALVAQP